MLIRTLARLVTATLAPLAAFALFASPVNAADNTVELHEPHRGISVDDPAFHEDGADCGGLDPADGPVVHFVANGLEKGTETTGTTIVVTYDGGAMVDADVAKSNPHGSTQHYFVQLPAGAQTVDFASVTFAGSQPDGKLVISHICPGDDPRS